MTKTPTVKEVRASLKELSMLKALPIIVKRSLSTSRRKGVDLLVGAPSPLGNCVATMFFNKGGNFVEALVIEPGRFAHCLNEGLSLDQAFSESRHWVDTVEDVEKYLKRQPYEWDGKKKWLKQVSKT